MRKENILCTKSKVIIRVLNTSYRLGFIQSTSLTLFVDKRIVVNSGVNHIMANNWNIPEWLEIEVRERDKVCVYCGCEFTLAKDSKRSAMSWEHIINDATIITRDNIALCCCGCNSSKGQKPLSIWLQTKYCLEREITPESVAPIIKKAITNGQ
tara:strand:- start:834 stop:1295 length:462 start_codon:yes stop_codon:yes gene_type:complete